MGTAVRRAALTAVLAVSAGVLTASSSASSNSATASAGVVSNTTADEAICTSVPTRLGSDPDRCGFGPRLPLLVISPYTKANSVSSKLTNQASVDTFIENNWLGGQRIGNGSFDVVSNSLTVSGLLNFHVRPNFRPVILNPATGEVVSG
jgi:phospholipase C